MLNDCFDFFEFPLKIAHRLILLACLFNCLDYQGTLDAYLIFVFVGGICALDYGPCRVDKKVDDLAGLGDFLVFPRVSSVHSAHNHLRDKFDVGDK